MRAYHIDLDGVITSNNINSIDLIEIPSHWENYSVLKTRYPDSISSWGYQILGVQNNFENKTLNLGFREENLPYHWNSYLIDILFEYERLASFPDSLSRMQAFFASKTIENALVWRQFLGVPNAPIYEIAFNHDEYEELDSSFLNTDIGAFSLPFTQNNAQAYWSGKLNAIEKPRTELLIKPKVSIANRIK